MEQRPDENTRDEPEATSAPADQVRGGEMDVGTPIANTGQARADFPDEMGDAPEQPTLVTSQSLTEPPHATPAFDDEVDEEDADAEHEAMTRSDLPRQPAAYGQARPRVERAMLASGGVPPREGEQRPPRMPRGWQPVSQQSGVRPRGYPTPRLAPSQSGYAPFEASSAWGPTTITITANTAAGFSYLFWWVSGLLVYFNERRNRFVRFHAVQSIMLTGVLSIFSVLAYIIAALFNDVFLNTHQIIWQTLSVGTVLLAVVCVLLPWLAAMIAAWSGTYLRLPIVGDYAERYAAPPFEHRPGAPNR